MKQPIRAFGAIALLSVGAVVAAGIGPAYADDPPPSAATAVDAVSDIPGVDDQTVSQAESPVTVPTDPDQPVKFDGLPVAMGMQTDGSTTTASKDGLTVYKGTDAATSTVVQPTDSGVRFMTVINDATAPGEYTYELTVPEGASAALTDSGGVLISTGDGSEVAKVDPPWAKDANGAALPTHYGLSGNTLTQYVSLESAAFPVVADPFLWVKFIATVRARYEPSHGPWAWTYMIEPTWAGRVMSNYFAYNSAWGEAVDKGVPNRQGLYEQFVCHPISVWARRNSTWNVNTWRPTVGLLRTIGARCNP